jgi:hypothetical protein
LGPTPAELDHPGAAELAAIEPDVVGADPGRQRGHVEQLLVEALDRHVQLALALVPVEVDEAVEMLRPRHHLVPGLRALPLPAVSRLGVESGAARQQGGEQQRRERGEEGTGGSRRAPGRPAARVAKDHAALRK